jgi:beta-lactam-binding protein with PASTA domain
VRSFILFLKSRQFRINLVLILVLISGIFFAIIKFLDSYTHHGQYTVVPDFTAKTILSLPEFVKDKNVSYQIIDSIYDPAEKAGIVLRQDPSANSKVKHNRTVYLYVTGMVPPQVSMPRLIDRSERQARLIIETYGLKVGKVEYKKADCNGCVLAQSVKGREIAEGQGVQKGSAVNIVVGSTDEIVADSTFAE